LLYVSARRWAERRRKGERDVATHAVGAHVATPQPLFGRQTARLLMADSNEPSAPEQRFVAHLPRETPGLAEAMAVAKRLNRLLRRDSDESQSRVLDMAADGLSA